MMTLDNLVNAFDSFYKFVDVLFVMALKRNHYKCAHAETNACRVNNSVIAFNYSGCFQFVDPLKRWCWRQPDLLSQLGIGDIGVGLEYFKYFPIDAIELGRLH